MTKETQSPNVERRAGCAIAGFVIRISLFLRFSSFVFGNGGSRKVLFRLCTCIGTMNPPPAPPRRGAAPHRQVPSWGRVRGSQRSVHGMPSRHRCSAFGTMNGWPPWERRRPRRQDSRGSTPAGMPALPGSWNGSTPGTDPTHSWWTNSGMLQTTSTERRAAGGDRRRGPPALRWESICAQIRNLRLSALAPPIAGWY